MQFTFDCWLSRYLSSEWSHRMPTYQRLPSDFPIRRPYPPPEKCEGPDLKWRQFAKQLPAHMKLRT